MSNPKWGDKRQCLECGARFYDLKRPKIVCPKCDAPFKLEARPKAKRALAPAIIETAEPKKTAIEPSNAGEENTGDKALVEIDAESPNDAGGDGDDDDKKKDNAFEDASKLGEGEGAMADVIDGGRRVEES